MRNNLKQAEKEVVSFYDNYCDEFVNKFLKDYPTLSKDILEEILAESIAIGFEKIQQSKFEQRSSLKTYIFGIGKNKIRDHYRLVVKQEKYSKEFLHTSSEADSDLDLNEFKSSQFSLVMRVFKTLEKHCQDILNAYILEGKNYKEIVAEFNYSNIDTAKSTKSRCLKHLKKLISNEIKV